MRKIISNQNKGILQILTGAGAGIILILVTVSVMTWLLLSEKIEEQSVEYMIMGILILASFCGSRISSLLTLALPLPASVITTGTILSLLMVGGLIADGPFSDPLPKVGAVVIGGLASCGCCLRKKKIRTQRKRHYR